VDDVNLHRFLVLAFLLNLCSGGKDWNILKAILVIGLSFLDVAITIRHPVAGVDKA
jgi:hypothetical protein